MTQIKRKMTDKLPNAMVGSAGYLHITTSCPTIGVPDAGCIHQDDQRHPKTQKLQKTLIKFVLNQNYVLS